MKYIEYDIAERYLHEACQYIGSNGGLMLKCEFREEPTIEIVRCKDCKWLDKRPNVYDCHNPRFGDGNCYYSPPYVEEDGFCKWGERKGGTE